MAGHRGASGAASAGWRLIWALCLLLCIVRTSAAQAPQVHDIDLHAASLAEALNDLSKQTGVPVVFSYDLVENRKANPVVGRYTVLEALNALLKDSGLSGGLSKKGVLTVFATVPAAPENSGEALVKQDKQQQTLNPPRAAHVASIATFFAAIASAFTANAQDASDSVSDGEPSKLAEVLVTAQKREERLQDTPVPVSVIDTRALTESNQLLLRDLNGIVPALSVTPGIENQQSVTIRGLSAGVYGVPTVGITVDDVLVTNIIPDFDPGDLARIEVLRGPQGTLYGANSIGGLLKYVTTDPSTNALSGRVQAGISAVHNGPKAGYDVRGSVNIPLTDTLAIRASAFTRDDPGYIDDVLTGQKGVNRTDVYGGRLSALWSPAEAFSLKLSALYQRMAGGEPLAYVPTAGYPSTAGLGDLQQNEFSGGGDYTRTFQLYNATVKARLGGIDLTSITGYNITKSNYSWDGTWAYGPSWQTYLNLNYQPGSQVTGPWAAKAFSQEIRASSQIGNKFDWQLGAYYSHDVTPQGQYAVINNAVNPVTGQPIATGGLSFLLAAKSVIDYAAFADLTYHLTEKFDVQVGARESADQSTSGESVTSLPLFGVKPFTAPGFSGKVTKATYSFTPRFRISDDLMVYARVASGYEPGGPNSTYGTPGVSQTYGASTAWNYEVGFKGELLDRRLSIDTSLYYIDWQKLQVQLTVPPGISYTGNAGAAKSEGVEFAIKSRPLTGLTVSSWVTYDDAALTESFPSSSSTYGLPGERLPYASRWSGNASLEQKFPLSGQVTALVGGMVSYVGDRMGTFTGGNGVPAPRTTYPAYVEVDLHAVVNYASWSANLFVNNLADRRAAVGGGDGDYPPFAYQYVTPRTIGLTFVKTF